MMPELIIKMKDQESRLRNAEHAVVTFARSLVFTLQDAGKAASAKELERLLFSVDVEVDAASAFMKENLEAFVDLILKGPQG